MITSCTTVEDCLALILDELKSPPADPADWAAVVATIVISAAAVVVSIVVFRVEQERVFRSERQALRHSLRTWFAGLSRSAKGDLRKGHRALDSQIKEDIGPVGQEEIQLLMTWALDVHRATWIAEDADRSLKHKMHAQRMYAKWIFRDHVAEWVLRPQKAKGKIKRLAEQGYAAIEKININDPKAIAKAYRPFSPESESEKLVRVREFG